MPKTQIIFFKAADNSVPVMEFLDAQKPARVKAKCIALIQLLAQEGYELKRPRADTLRDGIRELRTEVQNVNYRLLYFFHGQNCVIISHGITKEAAVPDREIDQAIENKRLYNSDPEKYSHHEVEQYYE
ncbi:MAG: type II toxin-antitoxin system RelE/ParE family toxin [Cyanobacteria bacterium SZAS TMP-1]|nr:type II toxin-antitoxin system RelE/ParE family toxin [Cyanobacteria bacterium SZAS TMP-1]